VNVNAAADLSVTFSEAVLGVGPATFAVRQGTATTGASVAGVITQVGNTFTVNPNANLLSGTQYTVTVSGGAAAIRDAAGNPLVSTSWSFTTADTVAPTVTASSPAVGSTGVAVGVNVTVTFSEPMNAATLTYGAAGSVTVRQGTAANGALVAAVLTFNAATRVVTVNPTANLVADTRYTLRVAGATDAAGNPVAATSWSFLTGPAPAVTGRTPGINATGVNRTANITATFGENMAAGSISTTTATLRLGTAAGGTLITSAVTYNAATRVVTINPGVTLAANTQYTVRLATGITDAAGNALPATQWSFTTGA
jgi:hypothetical protein